MTVVIFFFLCWSPYHTQRLLFATLTLTGGWNERPYSDINYYVYMASGWSLIKSSSFTISICWYSIMTVLHQPYSAAWNFTTGWRHEAAQNWRADVPGFVSCSQVLSRVQLNSFCRYSRGIASLAETVAAFEAAHLSHALVTYEAQERPPDMVRRTRDRTSEVVRRNGRALHC